MRMGQDSVAMLDTATTAGVACFRWLGTRRSLLARHGCPTVSAYPAIARFIFGGGHLGDVRYAADITVGVAGNEGSFAAFVLGADIPAFLREGHWRPRADSRIFLAMC